MNHLAINNLASPFQHGFAGAFDKVPHKRLIKKLQSLGTKGKTLTWIEYFLMERRQKVIINGEE